MIAAVAALLVAGGLGAVARHLVTRALPTPWGVLAVNAVGSLLTGVLLGLADAAGLDPVVLQVLLSGFLGGLTTFSTFAVETIELLRDGRLRIALLSTTANLALGTGLALAAYAVVVAAAS